VRTGLIDPEVGTLSKQAQLLCEDCIKVTPPASVGQGKRRVRFDVEKIFHPLDPAEFRSPSLQKAIRRSSPEAWNALSANFKAGPLAGTVAVVPSPSIHSANRDRRGRAKKTSLVTLWKQRGALKQVLAGALDRVGWAKAGWLRGYFALRGTRAPAWVTRHGLVRGQFFDGRTGADTSNWFIEVRNDTGWGKRGNNSQQIVNAALMARAHSMESYFNTQMRLAAAKFGKAA
jgi:hypothetical protein